MRSPFILALAVALAACGSSPSTPAATASKGSSVTNDLLLRASSSDFTGYDPGAVIDAVNALQPLGKDGALAAIDAFVAKRDLDADPHQGLFLVVRVLFDVAGDAHPPLLLGGSMPAAPTDPAALPRFPIMLVDDVPLMLISGYVLGGEAEPLASHLTYYRAHGTMRAAPLAPAPGVDRGAAYATRYQQAYGAPPSASERAFIDAQLARWAR